MSAELRETIIDSVLLPFSDSIDAQVLDKIRDKMAIVLGKYDITERSVSLTVYDDDNERMLKRYIGCLRIDGKSEKTIYQYARTCRKLAESSGKKFTEMGVYDIWMNMRSRTTKPSDHAWADYGGRGIKICDEWNNSFEAFRDWALTHGYSDSLSIDRIDNDGNYEPNNCRWATILQQARNKRNTIYITYDGKTLAAREWSEITGIPVGTIKGRYHDKWDVEKILTTPVKPTSRAVVSVDEEGNVKEYPSARAASKDVGVKSPNVTKACSGKNKTCAGKRWFYKEDYINEKSA